MVPILLTALLGAGAPDNSAVEVGFRDFTACIVAKNAGQAVRLLGSEPGSRQEARLKNAILDRNLGCATNSHQLEADTLLLRGGLAGALYVAKHGYDTPPPAAPVGFLPPQFAVIDAGVTAERRSETDMLYGAAVCAVSADPADAHGLVVGTPGSDAERIAMTKLSSGYAACFPEGRKASFSRSVLRALIAEALYRWTSGAVQPAATGKKNA